MESEFLTILKIGTDCSIFLRIPILKKNNTVASIVNIVMIIVKIRTIIEKIILAITVILLIPP